MAQKIPFFELFTDFSPDFDLRVPLNAAMVTNMVLEPEKRTMTLDMTVRAEMNDSTRETVEQLLARNYDLKRVDIHVKSTAEAFPDMLKNAGRKVSGSGSVIMGREIAKGRVLPISELTPKAGHVVVEGKVFKFDCETRRAGVWTMLLEMTDYEGSLFIRRSMPEREATELLGKISVGMWLRVSGRMELSYDGKDMQLNPQDIMQIDHAERTDTAEEKRVELHLHTRMSNMDALTDTAAVVKRAIKWGMPAIAITDHGVAQSFPDAWHTGEGKIKLLYGCEGYFLNNIDDRICVHGPQDGDFSTEICCFDIETTGLKVAHDAITEIGAVILKDGEIVDTFQTFVDPERRLSPEIIGLTGITDDMLRGAPKLEDALHAFLAFAGGRPLAAHNAEFDISFIRAGCKKCGIPFEPTYLDSLIFAQNLLPELGKYKLDIVADHLQLPQFNHHRASDDAVPVAQMLAKFFVMLEERGVTRLQQINDEMTKLRPLGVKRNRFPKHIILIAKNKVGLKNLYQLISASNLKYFKRVPIIPKSELVAHREGLIIGSACEAGELFRAIVDHKDWNELKRIASFYDYLEIQPLGNNRFMVRDGTVRDDEDLKDFNRTVVKLGEELGKPVTVLGRHRHDRAPRQRLGIGGDDGQQLRLFHCVDLVDDEHGRGVGRADALDERVLLLADGGNGLDDEHHAVDVRHALAHDLHHIVAQAVARLVKARRVHQDQLRVTAVDDGADAVARRLRLVRDDGDLLAHEGVGKRGLADVRPSADGDHSGFGNHSFLLIRPADA